ncbi:MFS transporter [Microbacterium sp. NPDC087665]|uniref:MFS transporter n=1 Tax=Microbacterium sp. NPDC087665 TaxID=3364194 RepID=UPI00380539C3
MSDRTEAVTTAAHSTPNALGFLPFLQFATGLLSAWYIVLLSELGREFEASTAELNWVNAIYMLATVVLVPILAKLGDVFGHRRLLLYSAFAVTAGTTLIALAPSFSVLLAGRALQAPLAAFLPLSFAIVRERAGESSGKAVGSLVGSATIGGALGGVGAGLALQMFGDLRPTLWIPVLVIAACIPGLILFVAETTVRAKGGVDWAGASMLGIGLLLTLGSFANAPMWGWTDVRTLGGIGIGLVVLVAWVLVERRVTSPLVDLTVLTKGGVGLPLLIAFLGGAQFFGSTTATTVFALSDPAVDGFGLGFTPVSAGLIVILTTAGTIVTAFTGDRFVRRLGVRATILVSGILVASAYLLLLLWANVVGVFLVAAVVSGLGNGLLLSVVPATIVRVAPSDAVGIASGLYNTARAAAGAIAGAFFAFVMASTAGGGASVAQFIAVWAICGVLSLVFALMGLFIPVRSVDAAGEQGNGPASLRMRAAQGLMLAMGRRMAKSSPTLEKSREITRRMENRLKIAPGVQEVRELVDGVPVHRYTVGPTSASVLHVHGGAYVGGSATFGRAHSSLARQYRVDVVSVDYRLAPEHPYPAAVEDALVVYRSMAGRGPIAIVGESAGGGLVLALAQRIRDEGLPMPVAVAAVMPWADLTQTSTSYELNRGRDMLTREGLTRSARFYAGEIPLEDPRVSPLFGSFAGFPSTLVLVGTHDSLLEDARAVHQRLLADGVTTQLVEIAGGAHGFVQLPVPEGRRALARIHRFLVDSLKL